MSRWGMRYVVVALGDQEEPATDADADAMKQLLEQATADRIPVPITFTVLSERTSDWLTAGLLRDAGAMPL